jgi:hypothetical protein
MTGDNDPTHPDPTAMLREAARRGNLASSAPDSVLADAGSTSGREQTSPDRENGLPPEAADDVDKAVQERSDRRGSSAFPLPSPD